MKVILIEEERFAEVTELMQGAANRVHMDFGLTDLQKQIIKQDIYRAVHFEFVRWAQSHGASCVKR
jgi:hypothetical protein